MMKNILSIILISICWIECYSQQDDTQARLDSINQEIAKTKAELAELSKESELKGVWGKGRYLSAGLSLMNHTESNYNDRVYAKFGAFVNKGTSYLWPERAFGGFLKVGIDVRWFDLQFCKLNTETHDLEFRGETTNLTNGLQSYPSYIKFHQWYFTGSVLGIGPKISIAPFAWANGRATQFKINLYTLYQPTYGVMAYRGIACTSSGADFKPSDNNHNAYSHGYIHIVSYGGTMMWKNVGAGVEVRWGRGRFHEPAYSWGNSESFYINRSPDGHYTRHFSSMRLFVRIVI